MNKLRFAMLLALFVNVEDAHSAVFTAYGHAQYSSHVSAFRWRFRISVDGCKWALEMIPESGVTGLSKVLLFNDGPWVGSYTYFTHTMTETEGVVLLEKNDYPENNGGLSQLVWLAYASQCVLDNAPTNRLQPITELDDARRRNGFSAPVVIERADSGWGVPRNITWYFNREEWESSLNLARRFTPAASTASESRVLWATFVASEFRNAGDSTIPSKVSFKAYEPYASSASQPHQAYECSIALERLQNHALAELFDRVFHGRATVEDRRRVKAGGRFGVDYRITNARPISPDARGLLFAQAQQEFHERLAERNNSRKLLGARTLLIVTALVFSLLFFSAAIKHKTKTQKEK